MPFRYDLNQISYDYTLEVTNRFKRLDVVDRVPEGLWTKVHDIMQEAVTRTKTCLSEEALQIAQKRREVKAQGETERCT